MSVLCKHKSKWISYVEVVAMFIEVFQLWNCKLNFRVTNELFCTWKNNNSSQEHQKCNTICWDLLDSETKVVQSMIISAIPWIQKLKVSWCFITLFININSQSSSQDIMNHRFLTTETNSNLYIYFVVLLQPHQ